MYHDFSLSEYFDRIEKVHLSILAERAPVDKSITLWWGFDGLRLNEDGTLEWVNRKPKEKVALLSFHNENANILSDNATIRLNQLHSMTALSQQDYMRYMLSQQINNLQTQIAQGMQNQKICQSLSVIDGCCGRDITGRMMHDYIRYSTLTQCCCGFKR